MPPRNLHGLSLFNFDFIERLLNYRAFTPRRRGWGSGRCRHILASYILFSHTSANIILASFYAMPDDADFPNTLC